MIGPGVNSFYGLAVRPSVGDAQVRPDQSQAVARSKSKVPAVKIKAPPKAKSVKVKSGGSKLPFVKPLKFNNPPTKSVGKRAPIQPPSSKQYIGK